jgi:hypothetical protein
VKKSLFVLMISLVLFGTLLTPVALMADGTPNPNCPKGQMCKP